MFNLTITKPDGQESRLTLSEDRTVVGRGESCHVMLSDGLVSRDHCLILREDKGFVVKDLGSRNGTWVNGKRIKNMKEIRDGDVIQVGSFRLRFDLQDAESLLPPQAENPIAAEVSWQSQDPIEGEESVVEPLGMISSYLSEATGLFKEIPSKVRRERINRNLFTLYRMSEELVAPNRELDDILDYFLDEIFTIFKPSQAIILLSQKDGRPVPVKQRAAGGDHIVRPVSNTIVQRILNDKVSVFSSDVHQDSRFTPGDSLVLDGIRSLMAAPIWEGKSILGLVYVDRLDITGGFDSEDMDLLTAMGHQAAVAIQRRHLVERVREQAIRSALIKENLGRYHSTAVVDLILQGAADLEAKETVATVLFCDIVQFTERCETATPQQLQEILTLFCGTVHRIVFDEQGTLDKFIGDAAMTIFGAPVIRQDASVRAVRAAVRIRSALAEAMKDLEPELQFTVRYGINTGEAIVGNFGAEERMDYTILGHAVNLASRITESAEPDQILIGSRTYEEIKDSGHFTFVEVGPKRFKGIKGEISLYEITDSI